MTAEQYGSVLIPVVMSKLPTEIRVQLAILTSSEAWSIREMLELIRKEVEAREASEHVKLNNEKRTDKVTHRTQIETFHQNRVLCQHNF